MNNLQKYIKETLNIELRLKTLTQKELNKLPLYLRNNLRTCEILGQNPIFVLIADKPDLTPDQYKKQSDIIENTLQKPVVFVFDELEPYNRKRLIQKKVAFIVPGRQMYIPFLLIELREFDRVKVKKTEKLFPAAQCLLFYYLLGKKLTGMNFKMLAAKLGYGTMTITRAANALSALNLCKIEGAKEKTLVFGNNKQQIWKDSLAYLINPIDKKVYTDNNVSLDIVYRTDINALAHYTNIAENGKNHYAISQTVLKDLITRKKIRLVDTADADICLQIWKYDPGILTNNRIVDPLSLYMTLKDYEDERIQGELQKLPESLW